VDETSRPAGRLPALTQMPLRTPLPMSPSLSFPPASLPSGSVQPDLPGGSPYPVVRLFNGAVHLCGERPPRRRSDPPQTASARVNGHLIYLRRTDRPGAASRLNHIVRLTATRCIASSRILWGQACVVAYLMVTKSVRGFDSSVVR